MFKRLLLLPMLTAVLALYLSFPQQPVQSQTNPIKSVLSGIMEPIAAGAPLPPALLPGTLDNPVTVSILNLARTILNGPAVRFPPRVAAEPAPAATLPPAGSAEANWRDSIGAFLTSSQGAQPQTLQSVWTPSAHVPLSQDRQPDTMLAGLFADLNPGEIGQISTPPSFPISLTDADSGLTINVDERLHFIINNADGDRLREFDLFMNRMGKLVAEYRLPDGTIDRESIDGYTLSISPDGRYWTGSDGERVFRYSLNDAGELVYLDENGDAYVIRDYEGGLLAIEAPDGTTGAFVPDVPTAEMTDDFFVYDNSGELIDSGSVAGSAPDASEEPSMIATDDSAQTENASDNSGAPPQGGDSGGDSGGDDGGGDGG